MTRHKARLRARLGANDSSNFIWLLNSQWQCTVFYRRRRRRRRRRKELTTELLGKTELVFQALPVSQTLTFGQKTPQKTAPGNLQPSQHRSCRQSVSYRKRTLYFPGGAADRFRGLTDKATKLVDSPSVLDINFSSSPWPWRAAEFVLTMSWFFALVMGHVLQVGETAQKRVHYYYCYYIY